MSDVIVIGGGPAGVAAAVELKRRGIEKVLLIDREAALGGATRHCAHSPFGLREFGRLYFGAAYGRKLTDAAERAGVEVRTGHSVVRLGAEGELTVANADGVETLRARRVIVAAGARETPRSARLISGERPLGIVTTGALQAHLAFHRLLPFRRPVIVGSEWVTLSAALTCLSAGARPVALLEPGSHPLSPSPFAALPAVVGLPLRCGAELEDIFGADRVEAIAYRLNGETRRLACDGVLFTGRFTPETGVFVGSDIALERGSGGPAVDQNGRASNPRFFAAGNGLRAVETGGWSFREGAAVGAAVAEDLRHSPNEAAPVAVRYDQPIKLVAPSLIRADGLACRALSCFQLRFSRRARGTLGLEIDGREVWSQTGLFAPERRILAPLPEAALRAADIGFRFRGQS